MISLCMDDEAIREGLFHDSRLKKNASGKPKRHFWGLLFDEIFTDLVDKDDAAVRKHYVESIGNRLAVHVSHNILSKTLPSSANTTVFNID